MSEFSLLPISQRLPEAMQQLDEKDTEITLLRAELAMVRNGADEAHREIIRFRAEIDAKSAEICELQTELHRVRPVADEVDGLRAELAAVKDERLTFRCRINALEQLGIAAEEAWKAAASRNTEEIALLREKVRVCSVALTPVSENEKRGMERVLAILDRKIAEGGGMVSSDAAAVERHNAHYRSRWSAFSECAMMLRAAGAEVFSRDNADR